MPATPSLQARAETLEHLQRGAADLTGQRERLQRLDAELREQFEHRHRQLHEEVQRREKELADQAAGLARDRVQISRQQEAVHEQQEALTRQQADLQSQRDTLRNQQADLQSQREALRKQQADLQAQRDSLRDQQGRLQGRHDDLRRKDEQVVTDRRDLTRQIEALQAELAEIRRGREQALAQRDDIAQQCRDLQSRVDQFVIEQAAIQPVAVSVPAEPVVSADGIAVLAAQAMRPRRRSVATVGQPSARRSATSWLMAAGVAVVAGLFTAVVLMRLVPARHWLQAQISFDPQGALASRMELEKVQRDLNGRLVEARLPGVLLPEDRLPVVAEPRQARLTVQVLTARPDQAAPAVAQLLTRYRIQLGGHRPRRCPHSGGSRARRAGRPRRGAGQAAHRRSAGFVGAGGEVRPAGQGLAGRDGCRGEEPQAAGRDPSQERGHLRPPACPAPHAAGARVDMSAEQAAAAAAGDVQLAEVRAQVAARAEDLRALLAGLLAGGTQKCALMTSQLDRFLQFLAEQQEPIADPALRQETEGIRDPASRLKDVVQRCRKQIDDLAAALLASKDIAQTASLIGVQTQSEKALESLSLEAADLITQVDALLEKLPAGGADVTRRTVLQERLRSRFAEVQKTQHEMSETLNNLRPAVNFKLDAALTAVAGLSRRYQERQKALLEHVQQQDAQARRQDYDRQLQQAQAEYDELAIERDRLTARLSQAMQEMADAEPGRSRLIQFRTQIDDLDRGIAAIRKDMEAARGRQNVPGSGRHPARGRAPGRSAGPAAPGQQGLPDGRCGGSGAGCGGAGDGRIPGSHATGPGAVRGIAAGEAGGVAELTGISRMACAKTASRRRIGSSVRQHDDPGRASQGPLTGKGRCAAPTTTCRGLSAGSRAQGLGEAAQMLICVNGAGHAAQQVAAGLAGILEVWDADAAGQKVPRQAGRLLLVPQQHGHDQVAIADDADTVLCQELPHAGGVAGGPLAKGWLSPDQVQGRQRSRGHRCRRHRTARGLGAVAARVDEFLGPRQDPAVGAQGLAQTAQHRDTRRIDAAQLGRAPALLPQDPEPVRVIDEQLRGDRLRCASQPPPPAQPPR